MRKDKDKAFELRMMGKSYRDIGVTLNVPVSTLSEWFSGLDWSEKIKNRLDTSAREQHRARIIALGRVRGERLKEIYQEAREEAVRELGLFKYHPLFIAGLMIYWGEGDRRSKNQVRISNTDPYMIRLFAAFLMKVCGVPKENIRASILIYPDLDDTEVRSYWAIQTGIAPVNFTKSTLIQGRHKTIRLGYGICNVNVSSSYLKTKILKWLEIFPLELIGDEYYASI